MGSRHQIYFSWELNHHNAYLANHDLLRVMLTAVKEAGTETGFRKEFARRLSATGLPDNVRSDSKRSDLWRDYQQLLKEWNLVSFGRKEVHLSALGELALDVSLPNAIALAVFRFQYPNPYKRRFPKWPRKSQEPAVDESDWCAYLSRHGVALRPAVVIARLLSAAAGRTRIPQISASDIRDRLFRITREPYSDDELLDRYLAPADSDWKGDRNRNAS